MEDNFNKHLGNKLKLRRLALGLTQTKVAKAINVTFQQIQKYEKGSNLPNPIRLLALSQYFKVPYHYWLKPILDKELTILAQSYYNKYQPNNTEEKFSIYNL